MTCDKILTLQFVAERMENVSHKYGVDNFFDLLNLIADHVLIVDGKGCILLVK